MEENLNQTQINSIPPSSPKASKGKAKFLISLIVIALLGGGYFALAKYQNLWPFEITISPSPTPDETSAWKTYRNEEFRFEIKHPEDWINLNIISKDQKLLIQKDKNTISISTLDFSSASRVTFQDWVNERPYALVNFLDRDALRWFTRSPRSAPGDVTESTLTYGTEHFIIPSVGKEWAVSIDMTIDEVEQCDKCSKIFDQILSTFKFIE